MRVSAGLSGAGKSHANQIGIFEHARRGVPICIVDRLREWNKLPEEFLEKSAVASSFELLEPLLDSGEIVLGILQCGLGEVQDETVKVARWAGKDTSKLTGIGLPEAHMALPKSWEAIDKDVQKMVTEWRHHNVAWWLDTQRFARLNTDIVELAREVRLFAMIGRNDFKALREISGGNDLTKAVQECAAKLDEDEPGWHVHLRARRSGPYDITRL